MRIAIFSDKFPLLSETFVINQIVGLIKLNVDVDILTNQVMPTDTMHSTVKEFDLIKRIKCFGLSVTKSKSRKLFNVLLLMFIMVFKGKTIVLLNIIFDKYLTKGAKVNLVSALIQAGNEKLTYDAIICHFGDNGYYLCKLKELGVVSGPIYTVFHGFEMSRYSVVKRYLAQYKKLFVLGDLMLPISQLWADKLIEWGCPASKVVVHRMGVDMLDFQMRPLDSSFSSPLKVIQVGRLTEKKAILDSINAIVLTSREVPVEFNIIGGGELYRAAEELIATHNAGSYINLLGPKPLDIVKQYLEEADVFLLPSIRAKDGDMEGIPVALMESMSKGLIALSTYHSGIPELIEDNVTGFLVEENSITELSKCLIKVYGINTKEVARIRKNARDICSEKFNNEVLNNNLLNLINR